MRMSRVQILHPAPPTTRPRTRFTGGFQRGYPDARGVETTWLRMPALPSCQESALSSFYDLTPSQQQVARTRRAALVQSIREADRGGFPIWIFCPWCSHSRLTEPRWLTAQVKDAPDQLEALEERLRCGQCKRMGVRLIPTDRTMVDFERMGASARGLSSEQSAQGSRGSADTGAPGRQPAR